MIARKNAHFCRNCHFYHNLSGKYAENSKETLSHDAYLYYNKKRAAAPAGAKARAGVETRPQTPLRTKIVRDVSPRVCDLH